MKKKRMVACSSALAALMVACTLTAIVPQRAFAAEGTEKTEKIYFYDDFEREIPSSLEYTFWRGTGGAFSICDGWSRKALSVGGVVGMSADHVVLPADTEYIVKLEVKNVDADEFSIVSTSVEDDKLGFAKITFVKADTGTGEGTGTGENTGTDTPADESATQPTFTYGEGAQKAEGSEAVSEDVYTLAYSFTTAGVNAYLKFEAKNGTAVVDNVSVIGLKEEEAHEYEVIRSDTFEGDAYTLNTSYMLSNPQAHIWNEVSTINKEENDKAIEGNSLYFDFSGIDKASDSWRSPLRVDPFKTDIKNGFYQISFSFADAGIISYHFQLKELDGDNVVGEYYLNAQTLSDMDTGNGYPCIGKSTRADGVTEVTLTFGTVKKVYIDCTIRADVAADERYIVLDNVNLYGYVLEEYPSYTYKELVDETYIESQGMWQKDTDCTALAVENGMLSAKCAGEGNCVIKSSPFEFEKGAYKFYTTLKLTNIGKLTVKAVLGDAVREFVFNITDLSTQITMDKVQLSIGKNNLTQVYTLSACFESDASDCTFEIYADKVNEFSVGKIELVRTTVLKDYVNSFEGESVPVKQPSISNTAPELEGVTSEVSKQQGEAGGCNGSLVASGTGLAALLAIGTAAVVKKRGEGKK